MEIVTNTTFEELHNLFRELKKSHDEKIAKKGPESGDPSSESEISNANFEGLLTRLDQILTSLPEDNAFYIKLLSMKSSLLYEQAKVLMSLGELDSSQALLEKALELITNHRVHTQITFLYMRLINHLAYLVSKKGDLEKSRVLLESILEGEEPKNNMLVYSTEELFSNHEIDQSQAVCKLNKLVANNFQMLGWIYGRLGQPDIHAAKLHMALERQLLSGDSDPINWACRCSRLAALYLSGCDWVSARYHLLAAGSVLDRLERELVIHRDLARAQADLARGWINYGLHLFSNSKAHLLRRKYPGIFSDEAVAEGGDSTSKHQEQPPLEFSSLEVNTGNIPTSPVNSTEEARSLFLHTHTWLKRARLFYTLRDFPIHYVNAVLDLSELYRFLAFYESDLDSQYNVQKRRADALETLSAVLREVRPQCYISVSVELLRELAEVQIEMMGLNLRRLHMTGEERTNDENNIKQRISAISNIQLKLETVGDMLGHGGLEDHQIMNKENPSVHVNETDVEYMNDIIDEAPQ